MTITLDSIREIDEEILCSMDDNEVAKLATESSVATCEHCKCSIDDV